MSLEEIIEQIRRNRAQVVAPRADPPLWDTPLRQEFSGYPVFNWTDDFNYSKCHTYEVLLHPGNFAKSGSLEAERALLTQLGGQKHSLLVKLSVIAPYYLSGLMWRRFGPDGQIEESLIEPQTEIHTELLRRMENFAEKRGFVRIHQSYLSQVVPGVELELAEECTVYNCLFEDEYGPRAGWKTGE